MSSNHPDPLKVIHEDDTVRIVEPSGKTSVTIHTAIKDDTRPFRVQCFRSSQEVKNLAGKTIARTTDPEMAEHICKLLIAHKMWSANKTGLMPSE